MGEKDSFHSGTTYTNCTDIYNHFLFFFTSNIIWCPRQSVHRVGQEWQEQLESGGVIVGNRYPRHTFLVNPAGPLSKGHFSDIDHRFQTELIHHEIVRSHTISRTNIRDIIDLNNYAFSKEMSPD